MKIIYGILLFIGGFITCLMYALKKPCKCQAVKTINGIRRKIVAPTTTKILSPKLIVQPTDCGCTQR